ncbi:MAG: TonB-dependent receptor [Bacteroidales bacterium]|jgi:outer membrane cobalamin receptor|nr:TonB-dependent receptor [Bacteroidales bacterium]
MKKYFYFILFFLWNISFSQESTWKDTVNLDEIVVAASKSEQVRSIVPMTISLVPQKAIQLHGHSNILPVIQSFTPGVFVTERGMVGFGVSTGAAGSISIRGVGGSPNTSVLVLIDGHPQYQGIFGHPLPDAYSSTDAARVEVIRGPASVLYGSNAMGGLINIVTKEQVDNGSQIRFGTSYACFNTQKYFATLGYKKDKLNAFFSVNHAQSDGHRKNTDFSLSNGYMKLGYTFTDNLSFSASHSIASYEAHDNGPVFDPSPFNIDVYRVKTSVTLNHTFAQTEGRLILFDNNGIHKLSDGWESTDYNRGLMFHQVFKPFAGNTLVCGIDYKNIGGIGNAGMASDSLILLNEFAGYMHIQQQLFDKYTVSAGLRLEHNSLHGEQLIPFVGATYAYNNQTSFKTSFSKGFRNPTIMELYLFAPNEQLVAEEMKNYEIAYTQYLFENRMRFECVGFISQGENLIQVVGQYPQMKRENVGTFNNTGVETILKYIVHDNLNLYSNYAYLHTKSPILAAPKHQFNIGIEYSYDIFSIYTSLQQVQGLYTSLDPLITEDYTRLHAKISIESTKWSQIFFAVNNILNQKYEINYGYPMPGLTLQYGVSCRF